MDMPMLTNDNFASMTLLTLAVLLQELQQHEVMMMMMMMLMMMVMVMV
jgi:hypothetical protein